MFTVTLFVICLLLVGVIYQYISTKRDEKRFSIPGKLIDIGGYKLHIIKNVAEGPSVVLDSGMGCIALDWILVQPEIAKFCSVVTYDRAGLGWSEISPKERTSHNIVEELHTLLHKAGIPLPFILVGHSFGGINVRLFANKYPNEVAGLVLIDTPHEDFFKRAPSEPSNWITKIVSRPQVLLFFSYIGLIRLFSQSKTKDSLSMFPEHIRERMISKRISINAIKTLLDEMKNLVKSLNQLKESAFYFGDKPLIVVTAGKYMTRKESGNYYSQEYLDGLMKVHGETQKELTKYSTNARQVIAEKSGHMIPYYQPDIIVEAVREVVSNIRPLLFQAKTEGKSKLQNGIDVNITNVLPSPLDNANLVSLETVSNEKVNNRANIE